MIELSFFHGLPVAVMGLGRSGLAAARALHASGADVWAWDDNEDKRAAAAKAGVPLVDLYKANWQELTTLVLSPGIPHEHPRTHEVARLAREHGCEIVCDVELLGRAMRDAQYLGVTGTNGKSTTTALIGHILSLSGRAVDVGGNLGPPALSLEALPAGGTYVLELSSYQLELIFSITFDVAVLLNISADHLDRHGGLEGYVRAKKQIFHRQTKPRTAVIGVDDPLTEGIYEELRAAGEQNVTPISGGRIVRGGIYVMDGILTDDSENKAVAALDLTDISHLPGHHNWQNAAAAYAACKAMGVAPPVICACIRSFPGLAHRQEVIAVIDGNAYINDSKATNADATAKALACYEKIYWIVGGQAKEGGLSGLEPYFDRIRRAYLIGEAEQEFAAFLSGKLEVKRCGSLEAALSAASADVQAEVRSGGGVVLLSPACASFDQFSDFEARGQAFRKLVEALPGQRSDPLAEGGPS